MVEYAHTLSKGIVRAFVKAIMHAAPRRTFDISEVDLSYSQRENIRKLQYWGLMMKVNDQKQKGGRWLITDRGMRFAEGKTFLPAKVWTYRGKVQRFDGKDKYITDITGGWKYRPDYAREAVPHGEIQ
jgi:hypothetical protein